MLGPDGPRQRHIPSVGAEATRHPHHPDEDPAATPTHTCRMLPRAACLTRELLEGEAGHLGDHVVDRGLERGGRLERDVVGNLRRTAGTDSACGPAARAATRARFYIVPVRLRCLTILQAPAAAAPRRSPSRPACSQSARPLTSEPHTQGPAAPSRHASCPLHKHNG